MKELIGAVLVFIVVGVAVMIGGAMVAKTENVTEDIAPNATIMDDLYDDVSGGLTTLTSLLPILALAVIGGLALFYLLGFMRVAV
jgi:hypothetical protein